MVPLPQPTFPTEQGASMQTPAAQRTHGQNRWVPALLSLQPPPSCTEGARRLHSSTVTQWPAHGSHSPRPELPSFPLHTLATDSTVEVTVCWEREFYPKSAKGLRDKTECAVTSTRGSSAQTGLKQPTEQPEVFVNA